jgi:glutamyl-tRNA synthetase
VGRAALPPHAAPAERGQDEDQQAEEPDVAHLVPEWPEYFDLFLAIGSYAAEDLVGKLDAATAAKALDAARAALSAATTFDHVATKQAAEETARAAGAKNNDVFMLLRVAVTGKRVSPPLFETMEILGKAECLARIEAAQGKLKS